MAQLAKTLTELSARQFTKLTLPEDVTRALDEARRIASPTALNRQLRIVRRTLRAADAEQLQYDVDRMQNPALFPSATATEAARWAERLLGEGDSALSALLELHPQTEIQPLRQLLRNANKAPAALSLIHI